MPSVVPDSLPWDDFVPRPVAVVGDVMLDRYWFGKVERISPEAPVPVVQVHREETRPGGAANVAVNVCALGAVARLLAAVGEDEAAQRLAILLQESGVEADLQRDPTLTTTVKLRVIGHQQQLLRMDFESRLAARAATALLARADGLLRGCGALLLSDYGKGSLMAVGEWIRLGRARGLPVLVDPKGRDYTPYRGATLLTPNRSEFLAVVGPWQDEADFVARGQRLRQSLELEALLVTRGEEGMSLFTASGVTHHPARAREVFDVTGAGDTVIATLATALAAAWPLERAVDLANRAAGIVVGKLGAATVTVDELRAACVTTE
ncbi:D-glycero-beta-D-manno-heptose-7-phosphate kinase [Acidithiobacillus sp.]|uniref:D-glycero-beta-D-manno-heptose-7-phosphate kinase n=1 Tax=Acidithiobacillus sp. TaxID=1872118 RepID=UPI0025BDA3EB|nr:D-glycero-beta-D-manno-heptose-7-phosphate kinase [Acidithiobacillus sp.]